MQWVQLCDFRNYRTLSYTPASQLNVLTGLNAQGKTNLLEGLAVLLTGQSFRTPRLSEVPRWGADSALAWGEISRGDAGWVVRRGIQREGGGACRVEGKGCPWARAVTFGWQDLSILNGPPQVRRHFLDSAAGKLYPAHPPAIARYRGVLVRRNSLLQTRGGEPGLSALLAPWDEQLISIGEEILTRRRAAVEALQAELGTLCPSVLGADVVRLTYQSTVADGIERQAFREALLRARREEVARGQTLVGPHRDDLRIELDGVDLRVFGSRGQQRAVSLALRLAEVGPVARAVGTPPVLLLDDALSELDPEVQAAVVETIEPMGQVFLSCAAGDVPTPSAAWWEVRGGQVSAAPSARVWV